MGFSRSTLVFCCINVDKEYFKTFHYDFMYLTNDMILVSSDGFHIPTNISVIISFSPILKNILSDFHYQTYEESTKIILPEYDAETINTFLELINFGDVCVERSNMKAVRSLLSSLCINQDLNLKLHHKPY